MAYTRVRYADPEHTQRVYSIALLHAGGGNEQLLTSPYEQATGPAVYDWSPDGQWIIGSCGHDTPVRIVICLFPISADPRAESKMLILISDPRYDLWQGRFSPDGRWVCFIHFLSARAIQDEAYLGHNSRSHLGGCLRASRCPGQGRLTQSNCSSSREAGAPQPVPAAFPNL